jgi:hypothetical protein
MFVTHDAFLIDDEVSSIGDLPIFPIHAECLHHASIGIAEKSMFDFGEVDESLLRERGIGADAYNLGILSRKLAVVFVRTGRLKVRDSRGAEIQRVEIDENVLAFQAAQFEFAALSAGQLKIRSLLSHFQSHGGRRIGQKYKQCRAQ